MGIRYNAFPVPADIAESAANSPADYFRNLRRYAGEPSLSDAELDLEIEGQELSLDKAWRHLQGVLGSDDDEPRRPAYELVHGDVEHTGTGWKAFVRVLTAQQVGAAAADLATVDPCEVMERLSQRPRSSDDPERYAQDVEYTLHYLQVATEYLAQLARRGHGLAYHIG